MLELSGVCKTFGRGGERFLALDGISLQVREGEFVSIVGTSGCGKTTLLNIIAGLMRPDGGSVSILGKPVRGVSRSVGYTFQQATLLPWRTVLSNVELGLELRGVAPATRRETAMRLLEQVDLAPFAHAYPHQLSGGMAKRAEIVRILAIDPDLLLMDEPFGALDAQTKINMQDVLLHVLQTMRKTVIFITHDLEEAVVLSDRVLTLAARPGRVKHEHVIGLPRPRDSRAARLDPRFADFLRLVWDDIEPSGGAGRAR